jgi:putative hydrolase of the HAD superfamily
MSVRLVTFDAGNTLVYAYPSLGEIYARVAREFGADVEPDRFVASMLPAYRRVTASLDLRAESDDADREMWKTITGLIHSEIAELRGVDFESWFSRLYSVFGSSEVWRAFDDVDATLKALASRGITVGLVSNWDARLRNILRGLGLADRLRIIKISSEVGARKPHPRMFEQAQAEAGIGASEALHVGDRHAEDIVGATSAGWRAALIDRSGENRAQGSYPILHTLTQIVDLL